MNKRNLFLVILIVGVISVGASFWVFQPGKEKEIWGSMQVAEAADRPTAIGVKEETLVRMGVNPRQREGDFQAGVCVPIFGNDKDFKLKIQKLLNRVASLGVNSVSLVFPIFQENWKSTSVYTDRILTPSTKRITTFIREAHKWGFIVMLRPILDEQSFIRDGTWRGEIEPQNRKAWFESYTALILEYGKLAEEENVEIFNIGSEFTSLEQESSHWLTLIEKVREVYNGKVIYSVNYGYAFGSPKHTGFWKELDFVGIDAYFELDAPLNATVEQLIAAWQPSISLMKLIGAREKFGKDNKLVVTEIGTRSQLGSFRKPWLWEDNTPLDLETQRRYYEAACRVLVATGLVSGIYWWAVELDLPENPASDSGSNPLGKPAEMEIKKCFEEVLPQLTKTEETIDKIIEEFAKEINLKRTLVEKSKRFSLGAGSWFPKEGDSFLIGEAQLRLKGNLRLFGGGGEDIVYGGLKYGDMFNVGMGGIRLDSLDDTEFMVTGGLSFGSDRIRLEGDYFYLPNAKDESGVKATLGIRF